MQAFKKIDMESWPRREHYRYYTEALKVEFNMTAPVDVQNLLRFCHAHGCKFYAAAIYCVTKALNRIENGQVSPTLAQLELLSDALDCTITDLFAVVKPPP